MKLLRVVLWSLAGLLLLLALIVGLAFVPAVQLRVARAVLAGVESPAITIEGVAAGLSRTTLHGVTVRQPGLDLTLPQVEVDVGLLGAALRREVVVTRLVAREWTLDTTAPANPALAEADRAAGDAASAAPEAQAAELFSGLLQQVQLPVDLSVEGVDLAGTIVLPGAPGRPPVRAAVTLTGGGLRAGQEGRFLAGLRATVGSRPDDPVQELVIDSTLTARLGAQRNLDHVAASTEAVATGAQFPNGARIRSVVTTTRNAGGEAYTATVEALDAGVTRQLMSVKADFTAGTPRLAGTWRFDVRQRDVVPFALGFTLPDFELVGEGSFEAATNGDEARVQGRVDAAAGRLEVIDPHLEVLGRLRIVSQFDVVVRGQTLRVQRLSVELANSRPVAALQVLQPFEFVADTATLKVADPALELLNLALTGVPVAWAQPWLTGLEVTADDLRGELLVKAHESGFALHAREPLALRNIAVRQARESLVQDLDLSLGISAEYTSAGWQALLNSAVQSAGRSALTISAKVGQRAGGDLPIAITSKWEADLAALVAQPALRQTVSLRSGMAAGDLQATLSEKLTFQSRLTLTDVAAPTYEPLPLVRLQTSGEIAADGAISFTAPVVIETTGRASDLTLQGRLALTAAGTSTLDAKVSGQFLAGQELARFAELAPLAETPARPRPPTPAPAPLPRPPTMPPSSVPGPTLPFWGAISGVLSLELGEVTYGPDWRMQQVTGVVRLSPERVELEGVKARFGEGSGFSATAGIDFAAREASAYRLTGQVDVQQFDTGAALRAFSPDTPPSLETRLDISSRLRGDGADLPQLLERVQGDFQLGSKAGVLRMPIDAAKYLNATQAIAGLIGGQKTVDKFQPYLDVARELTEIRFDQLNVAVARDNLQTFAVRDLAIISPTMRLSGSGAVENIAGATWHQLPLTLNLQLGVRGALKDRMSGLRLLSESTDALGYSTFYAPVQLDGTLAKIGTARLAEAIGKAALSSLSSTNGSGRSSAGDFLRGILPGILGGDEKKSEPIPTPAPESSATPTP